MPLDVGSRKPRQALIAIAASTADPPRRNMSIPGGYVRTKEAVFAGNPARRELGGRWLGRSTLSGPRNTLLSCDPGPGPPILRHTDAG